MSDPSSPKVRTPTGFVPEQAIAFTDASGASARVGRENPLPVTSPIHASTATPLAGTASASGAVGPFVPELGRPIMVSLSGGWTGSVQVLRSTDGGATRLPLTVGGLAWASFTANANEAVAEEHEDGATYYLAITLASGSLTYRVAQ